MSETKNNLPTDPYKGVRDFFPEDMAIQKKIFGIWRETVEKYGYQEYNASVLEPASLYRAKTGEEIVSEQTYTFTDRGNREVTLRPEMTPTVARMIAARKRELVYPLRWYSIPNLFRYEQPQRGRLREHWQLNVDIFGVSGASAEIEIINCAYDIVRAYGLKETDFEIRINNRTVMEYVSRDIYKLPKETALKVSRLIDKKSKLSDDSFKATLYELFRTTSDDASSLLEHRADEFLTLLNSHNFDEFTSRLPHTHEEHRGLAEIREVIGGLERLGITNARFDQTLMRGFDYYTGTVFEIFDLNPTNKRSVCGGGRYDDLLSIFGNETLPAVGFGMGDVIARDLMETYGTLPSPSTTTNHPTFDSPAHIALCVIGEHNTPYALDLAQSLRTKNIRVAVNLSHKKVGDQIAHANSYNIPRIVCIGDEEVKSGIFKIKNLSSGTEVESREEELARHII